MPMVVPVIAAAAAYAGTYGVVVTTYGALAASIAGAVAATAASYLASSVVGLNKRPDINAAPLSTGQVGRLEQTRNPAAFHQYVFGRIKTSGVQRLAAVRSTETTANGQFYLIHALCGALCHRIGGIYLNEKPGYDDIYSESASGVTGGLIRVGRHLGTETQLVDDEFFAEIPASWTADHRGRGICYIATRLEWNQAAFGTSGLPQIFAILDGITNIYDPRLGYTVWTNNWALCVAHYLMAPWGKSLPLSKIHLPTWIASANICDERIEVAHSAEPVTYDTVFAEFVLPNPQRALNWGDGIRFSTSDTLPGGIAGETTYYIIPGEYENRFKLATSPANAFSEIAVTITSAGLGNSIVYWDEARYTCNGMFTSDTDPAEVLEQLKTAAAGYIFPRGGKWFIHAGAAASLPFASFDEYDLAGNYQYVTKRSLRDSFNGVRGRFFNPDNYWQEDDSPVLRPTQALIDEDGEERYVDRQYPFTTSARCVQRLMKIDRELNRQQEMLDFPANLAGMKVAPLDGVTINIAGILEDKAFRCGSWALEPTGTIQLTLHGHSGNEYDWSIADELSLSEPDEVDVPDASDVVPPTLTVSYTGMTAPPSIWVTWTAVNNTFATGYELQYRTQGVSTWTTHGTIPMSAERKVQIPRTIPQDIRIRTLTGSYLSDWYEAPAPVAPSSVATPAPGEITWSGGAGTSYIQLFKNGDPWNMTVPNTGSVTGLNDGTYELRAVSAAGNMSALSAQIVVSTAGPGDGGQGEDLNPDSGEGD